MEICREIQICRADPGIYTPGKAGGESPSLPWVTGVSAPRGSCCISGRPPATGRNGATEAVSCSDNHVCGAC